MPIYVYECQHCSHEFEVLQRVGEGSEELSCPECQGKELKKLVTTFRSHFWSGFLDDLERKVSPQKFDDTIPKATPDLIKDLSAEIRKKKKKQNLA